MRTQKKKKKKKCSSNQAGVLIKNIKKFASSPNGSGAFLVASIQNLIKVKNDCK